MAKRKITVTVDDEVVDAVRRLEPQSLSAVVNDALVAHVDRLVRLEALQARLDEWDERLGPVSDAAAADAVAAFDALDEAVGESVTSDADDIVRLAAGVPAIRIVTRAP